MNELVELKKEELIEPEGFIHYLTVGELKKFLEETNLPDNSPVLIQRVEDFYYEKWGWGVYMKENENSFSNEKGEIVKESLTQYHPAFSCAFYKDEDNILFINLHY